MILQPYESEGSPYFFRLQCPSGWEVVEWAWFGKLSGK